MATETPEFDPTGGRGFTLIQSVIVVLVAFLAAVLVAQAGATLLGAVGVSRESMAGRVGLTVLQFAGFGVGIAGVLYVGDDWAVVTDHVRRPTLRDAGYVVAGLVAVLAAAAAVGQLLSALGIDVAQNQVIAIGQENPEFFLYMIPVSLLLVGPMEELLFRGTVQGLLRRAWGPAAAIVVASAMFGLVHWVALTGAGSRVSYVAVAAALGLVLGTVYELTGNVAVPAAVHGTYNAVLFAVQYAVATGMAG